MTTIWVAPQVMPGAAENQGDESADPLERSLQPLEYDDAGLGGYEEEEEDEEEKKEEESAKPLLSASKKALETTSKKDMQQHQDFKAGSGTKAEDTKESEDEAKDFLNQIKSYLGLGEIAEDAEWIKLTYHDHEANCIYDRGELALSVEIVPWEEAEARKVGYGRDEPNTNPYLPPPMGRMQFTVNPIIMLKELMGPTILFRICCCICIMLILVIILFVGTYTSGLVSIIQIFKGDI